MNENDKSQATLIGTINRNLEKYGPTSENETCHYCGYYGKFATPYISNQHKWITWIIIAIVLTIALWINGVYIAPKIYNYVSFYYYSYKFQLPEWHYLILFILYLPFIIIIIYTYPPVFVERLLRKTWLTSMLDKKCPACSTLDS